VGAAAAGQTSTSDVDLGSYGGVKTSDDLRTVLVPQYLQDVPRRDGWKFGYEYYLKTSTPSARQVMAIRSKGRDNAAEASSYSVTSFDPTDYDRDIIWADGFMVRWPQKN
jgi:hypothetical protein